jgi:Nuclease-related domain
VVYSRSLCARSITLWYMDRTDPAASHPGSESPESGPGFLPAAPADTWPGTPAGTGPQFVPGTPAGTGPQFVSRIPPETGPGLVPWPRTILGMSAPHHGSVHQPAVGALQARLAREPRKLGWILRAVASAMAGGAVSAVAGWRLGLTAAAVIAIADTILRSRAAAAIPAGVRAPAAHRRTRRRLARLGRAGYRSLHARVLPGSQRVIDHLVVGPGGIYSVDSERWDSRMPVRATKGGRLYHGPFSHADRLADALWAADEARRLLSAALGEQIAVQAVLVIYGPTIPWTVASISGVDVLSGRRLRKYLRHGAQGHSATRLGADEIERIHAAAAQALPPAR